LPASGSFAGRADAAPTVSAVPRVSALVVMLLALAAAACGERSEPLATELSAYPVTVRGAGEEPVVVRAAPERVVALTPAAAELAAALGAGERLVGLPSGVAVPGAARARTVVRPSGLFEASEVAALDPDAILAAPETDADLLARVARRTGALVYRHPNTSIRDVLRATIELGFVLDEPVAARRLAAAIRRDVGRVDTAVAGRPPVRVFVDLGFFVPAPPDSLVADLVRRAGGVLVPSAASEPTALTPCQVVRLDPDLVLLVVEPGDPPRPPLTASAACPSDVRQKTVSAERVARAGPEIAAGLADLARALHGDAVSLR
jgi:cobalamin transport system substrate-binding protein